MVFQPSNQTPMALRAQALALLLLLLSPGPACADEDVPLVEPYPALHGDDAHGAPAVPASPDPLVRTTWSAATNITGLQIYNLTTPVAWLASPPSAFTGLESLASGQPQITVNGSGSLRLDFGREHAAWFEFESADLGAQSGAVRASISEYNEPWPGKTQAPKAYAGGQYRLETNNQLYEGVRYAWIFFEPRAQDSTCVATGKEDSNVQLTCSPAEGGGENHISAVTFAEFGTANGDCHGGFHPGSCAVDLSGNLTAACVGQSSCSIHCIMGSCKINNGASFTAILPIYEYMYLLSLRAYCMGVDILSCAVGASFSIGGDPCPGTPKHITAQVVCAHTPAPASVAPWHISGVRLVAQSKPANYTGSFTSADEELTKAWYSGAYGSRLNMMPYGLVTTHAAHHTRSPVALHSTCIVPNHARARTSYTRLCRFNSILMDRGDRVSIQGDGHPTMAAALAAFPSRSTSPCLHFDPLPPFSRPPPLYFSLCVCLSCSIFTYVLICAQNAWLKGMSGCACCVCSHV
eukprot:COSAG05_NODE_561_length_8675_cov_3.694846_12_plen_521_part_00